MPLATMNWKRGLLRLWAVVSVLWFGLIVQSLVKTVGDDIAGSILTEKLYGLPRGEYDILSLMFVFSALAFIPPLLLLALGYIGLWVGRGFRR